MSASKNISTIMIIIAVCSIGGIIFGGYLLVPKFQEFQAQNDLLESKRNELKYREEYFLKLQAVETQIKEYKPEIEKISVALPNDPSLPSLFDYLQRTCSQSGLVVNDMGNFTVSNSSKHAGLKEISIKIGVSGPYESLKAFISVLEKSSRLIDVEGVSFGVLDSQEQGGRSLDIFPFSISLKVYSY